MRPRLHTLFFRTVESTLLEVAADRRHLGARIGFLAILHTWTQTLLYHPHLHVVAPGGGLPPHRDLRSTPPSPGGRRGGLHLARPSPRPRQRTMRLDAHEFLRRFLLHVLPDGFVRIRCYGLLANRDRHETLARCREALGVAASDPPLPATEAG